MKFPVIMCYYCEDIMSIFWSERKIKAYRAFLQGNIYQTKEIKTKKIKASYIVIDKMQYW